ncbi:hypothetical protein PLICRDRAFT_45119 [Plicaturopsis crispa FD-325 SS-3]|uniref:N-acetyltransferase domain-containing protein n=1 Tax=Plicaturopsis crispa FD-325 SS-3 TaxID=944288 RepID=A0A0C9SYE8_PLICR|nr:hypothetical protein PLICRDRAFT_45119 [Plicaturopsis crispa FD-325 SS-3]
MSFVNLYQPPIPVDTALTPSPDPYDINYAFPLPLHLESDRVRLTPFIPSIHGHVHDEAVKGYEEELYRWISIDLSGDSFKRLTENYIRRNPNCILFAAIDKTKPDPRHPELGGSYAGYFGLLDISAHNLATEIGPVVVLPEFRGTGISTHAIGLLLCYCLDLPSAGGLGLRRAYWHTNEKNIASIKLAQKAGLRYEGTMRWNSVLAEGKEGNETRKDDPVRAKGRNTALLAVCWDDWEGGLRERTNALLGSPQTK